MRTHCKHVVLRLLTNRSNEAQTVCNCPRLREAASGPLRRAPVQRPSTVNDVIHGSHNFLNGCDVILAMAEDDVDVSELHTRK